MGEIKIIINFYVKILNISICIEVKIDYNKRNETKK